MKTKTKKKAGWEQEAIKRVFRNCPPTIIDGEDYVKYSDVVKCLKGKNEK